MEYGARPLRSTRRLSNSLGQRPAWYHIANSVAGVPTQVSIYDEIGFFGVAAGEFMADLKAVNGDIELHINSPGGDVHDGIAIYNQLKQRKGQIHVIVDGLAASAASFIAQAATPGRLEVAPHAQMMVHNGFSMAIGDAADLRKTADLLDSITGEIAAIYSERSGKPVDFWLGQMADETWYTDKQAVAVGLADAIHGQPAPAASWDLSVFGRTPPVVVNADGGDDASACKTCSGKGRLKHPVTGKAGKVCPSCGGTGRYIPDGSTDDDDTEGAPDGQAMTGARRIRNDDGTETDVDLPDGVTDLGDGWVCDPDGTVRFDPDGDGDDDSTPEGDTDHDYFAADGSQIQPVPPRPESDGGSIGNAAKPDDDDDDTKNPDGTKKPFPGAAPPFKKDNLAGMFPVLAADVDNSPWDASRAWKAGAASDDPGAFYKGICAGRKAGDPSTQAAWALPYKYSPSSAPNAAGVKNALARLPQTKGLTNHDEAEATLQKAMKAVNPDYDPDTYTDLVVDAAMIAGILAVPEPVVDDGGWNPGSALALAAKSGDPAAFYRGICAGRRQGNPATAAAWALPYRYTPGSPPNARGVREALAELPSRTDLANHAEARGVLERALKAISPDPVPDDDIDPELLAAAFALGLKGASK